MEGIDKPIICGEEVFIFQLSHDASIAH